jgi:FKBP12-rapamycin complex-associated protein
MKQLPVLPANSNQVTIREGASESLHACLEIIYHRESNFRLQWYKKIIEETHKGFKIGTVDSIHGSLLTLGELFIKTGRVTYMIF